MRLLAAGLIVFVPLAAHADLYRWIDPDSGSVKLSSLPPSDPQIQAQIVPYSAPTLPKPGAPASTPAAGGSAALAELESRWNSLLTLLTGLTPQDFKKGAEGLRQHLEAYESVRAELDRLDPAGAARRRTEVASVMERIKQGLASQFSPTPPR
jgi:hypothetical protein